MARTRSPSYPGIDLKEALEKARVIYEKEGTSSALVDTISGHWGYKAGTGSANVAIAALKKFGLVEYEGSGSNRRAKLTDTALRIIRDDRSVSPDRDDAIRQVALRPDIHKELWERSQSGASDETLISFLKLEREFSDSAAPDLVDEFRSTVAYADLGKADKAGDMLSDKDDEEEEEEFTALQTPDELQGRGAEGKPRVYRLPLTSRLEAVLQVPPSMNEVQWDQMMAVLAAMKPGILSEMDNGADSQK